MIVITLNPQDFEMTLATLTHIGAVVVEAGAVTVKKSTNKTTAFLSQMFEPFLLGYWVWRTSCFLGVGVCDVVYFCVSCTSCSCFLVFKVCSETCFRNVAFLAQMF